LKKTGGNRGNGERPDEEKARPLCFVSCCCF
jgi:hypothetical protein